MPVRRLCGLLAAIFLMSLAASAQAEAYRWTDANGVVHFSQLPPPGKQATAVNDQPIETLSGAAAPPPAAAAGAPAPADTRPAAAPAKASPQACREAQKNLAVLQSGRRIKEVLPNGATHWLTPAERDSRLKQTRDFIQQHCH